MLAVCHAVMGASVSPSRPVPSAVGQTAPAVALAQRVLGTSLAQRFSFEAECTQDASPLCFTVKDAPSNAAYDVVIGGTTPVEMAAGLNWYEKR